MKLFEYQRLAMRTSPDDGLSPMPLQLDDQDAHNLRVFGKTGRKRIHQQATS